MKFEIKGDNLVLTIPINQIDPPESKSGKTLVVASTRGNVHTNLEVLGQPVTIGFNAYIAKPVTQAA